MEFLSLEDEKKSEFASTSVFVNQKLPSKNVLRKYKNVAEQIACTSDISVPKYGLGVISREFDLSLQRVKTDFYGTAGYVT